jgi:hypothetical protein
VKSAVSWGENAPEKAHSQPVFTGPGRGGSKALSTAACGGREKANVLEEVGKAGTRVFWWAFNFALRLRIFFRESPSLAFHHHF